MTDTFYVGLMSGTSLDGVDAVLVCFSSTGAARLAGSHYLPFPEPLRQDLVAINAAGYNEIERSELLANQLAHLYANCVDALLARANHRPADIAAIGCHGQTIRHRPDLGFTVQIGNSALLAELTGIAVVSDFRSRDVAAGGQGAPLVPAFHHAMFGHSHIHRVIVNIGGISNLTDLPPAGPISGFDCGPGNLLMDAWIRRHNGECYDRNGEWAATGTLIPDLLQNMLLHPFLKQLPPKSTGRDTFNINWLETLLHPNYAAADVQSTLLEFAARCISDDIIQYCSRSTEIYLCGGGAHNATLTCRLQQLLGSRSVLVTDSLNLGADWVEAAAFAWLARQTFLRLPGNMPVVTGAGGYRILGAIYLA
ncbi:anhydro-N-acetylmuramic acid kinase [mine drainage metagenome]|uniref:Anhydro-N-acetylmuramic acid kinase n=1 Tax=mine drainage metagenome TaxID=410659 RepID=A0A1J5RR66_9ZZZZ